MYNSDTELLFPLRVIAGLRDIRGEHWQGLIDRLSNEKADPADQQAFVLMMVRLCSCTACDADSYRAMKGCSQCAKLMIKRYRGSDQELISQFIACRREVENYHLKLAAAKQSST